jgi:aminoglycoside phosphotransferase (APT) family kinase protein
VIANFLFDPDTYQILGLVDFDCSHTGHPLHEFFFSSFSLSYYALVPDPEIVSALFHGFPSPLPPSTRETRDEYHDDDAPQWPVMKMFEEELERVDAIRPSNVLGGEKIAKVYGLISEVCPNHYGMQRWVDMVVEKKGDEGLHKIAEEHAAMLGSSLASFGF